MKRLRIEARTRTPSPRLGHIILYSKPYKHY
jgi:hypothetical protein